MTKTGYYRYKTFGLTIESQIELPELLSSDHTGDSDLIIKYGPAPTSLPDCTKKGVTYEIAKDQFLLDLKDIARYYISHGNQIIIDRKENSLDDDIRIFLLGSCLGAILQQRKVLPMHASAIDYNGEAVLFTGISGAGKSSTANAFRLKGYKMLTDDVCPIIFQGGNPFALPGYPQSKLWDDTLHRLEVEYENLKMIRNKINKRAIPITEQFVSTPLPVKALYILQPSTRDGVELFDVENVNKFRLIKNMTYRKYLLKDIGAINHHFMDATRLANLIPVKRIRRSHAFCLDEVVDLIEKDLFKIAEDATS